MCRAVDRAGQTVDFMFKAKRDITAAKAFFSRAIKHQGQPSEMITLDGYAASHWIVRKMIAEGLLPEGTHVRSSKCLNNVIEQDPGNIKSGTNVRRIRKGQFDLGALGPKDTAARVVSNSVLVKVNHPDLLNTSRPHQLFAHQSL